MISNGKELYRFLDSLLVPNGFVRKKDTYYLNTDECICFFSIGKSDLGGHYDHAMGCFLKEIMNEANGFPKYYKSHLRYSIDSFIGRGMSRQVFDLENRAYVKDERENIIKEIVEKYVIPFLKKLSSKKGIIDALAEYEDLKYRAIAILKDALGIPYED